MQEHYVEEFGTCYLAKIVHDQFDADEFIESNPEYMILRTYEGCNPKIKKEWWLVKSDDKGIPLPETVTATIQFLSDTDDNPEEHVTIALHDYDPDRDEHTDDGVFYYANGISEVNSLFHTENVMDFKILSYELDT